MALTKDITADQLTQELEWIATNGSQCPYLTLKVSGMSEEHKGRVLNDIIKYFQETIESFGKTVRCLCFQFKEPVGWPTDLNNVSSDGSGCMIGRGYDYPRDMDWTLRNKHSGESFKVYTHSNVQETLVGEFSISIKS